MSLIEFLYGVGALQGMILGLVLLLARSVHRQANVFISLLVFVISLYLLRELLGKVGVWADSPALALLLFPPLFLMGPLLYFYAFTLTGGQFKRALLLHLLPAAMAFLFLNIPYWQLTSEQQLAVLAHLALAPSEAGYAAMNVMAQFGFPRFIFENRLLALSFAFHFGGYCLLVLSQIGHHNRRLKMHYSSLESLSLRWLRLLTGACLIYIVVMIVFRVVPRIASGEVLNETGTASTLILVLLVYGIAFGALFQPSLVSGLLFVSENEPQWTRQQGDELEGVKSVGQAEVNGDDLAEDESSLIADQAPTEPAKTAEKIESDAGREGKKERPALSMEEVQRIQMQLMTVMREEELYLDCELTLSDLAAASGISAYQISRALNGRLGQNFFSFVNGFRLHRAQQMLLDPETSRTPIVELALAVGFKSRSSFYDAFKAAHNMTPTQFKKAARLSSGDSECVS